MRVLLALALLLTGCSIKGLRDPKMISVMEQNGVAYVPASGLDQAAHIAVKALPGQNDIAVCSGQRCALVKDFVRKGDEIWVGIGALERTLGLKTRFSIDRRSVAFDFDTQEPSSSDSPARVGELAPNFRVARLDGSPVSLADFRGKRVVINSWASW